MAYILQVDFPHDGIFGDEFSKAFTDLAKDIASEDGLLWKIWTENKNEKTAGGIYYFKDLENAKRYKEMHTKRLESFGYKDIRAKIFEANKELSKISKADFLA
ncbi:monooxygenase [Arcobacter vandammei]|uniref:monooxygenase n=1 Tax=Arcobacter vandammei TaxID=2782243 RepID=UPI0018DF407E|nr:monooxygenase [Arcobacter vandammei]